MGNKKISAGLLMYRIVNNEPEFFLAHPGGPYFHKKDNGHWSIPKGEPDDGEDLLKTALREFKEETGIDPAGEFIELGSITQKGGKVVYAWGFKGDLPENYEHSCNTFFEEWPPKSGRFVKFPEVDKVSFFSEKDAKEKIKSTQIPLIDKLIDLVKL